MKWSAPAELSESMAAFASGLLWPVVCVPERNMKWGAGFWMLRVHMCHFEREIYLSATPRCPMRREGGSGQLRQSRDGQLCQLPLLRRAVR